MKMSVTRVQSIMDRSNPALMLNLSMQAARDLAQTFQAMGVRSVRLATVETMGGSELRAQEVEYFDEAPDDILSWSKAAIRHVASYMAAFGISSVTLECDESDMPELRRTWRFIATDSAQYDRVRASGHDDPSSSAPEPEKPVRNSGPFFSEEVI